MNAQWLGDILLGNFEALRQVQCSRYTAFNLPDPFAPSPHLVVNLLGEWPVCRLPAPQHSTFSQRRSRWEGMRGPGGSVSGG